jgi:hypothetical protein
MLGDQALCAFAVESTGDAGTWRNRYLLEDANGSTVLRNQLGSIRSSWFSRMLFPLILATVRSDLRKNLTCARPTSRAVG